MKWICYFNEGYWSRGNTPQEAYDNLCEDGNEEYDATVCMFYKETFVDITPPVGAIIKEV